MCTIWACLPSLPLVAHQCLIMLSMLTSVTNICDAINALVAKFHEATLASQIHKNPLTLCFRSLKNEKMEWVNHKRTKKKGIKWNVFK